MDSRSPDVRADSGEPPDLDAEEQARRLIDEVETAWFDGADDSVTNAIADRYTERVVSLAISLVNEPRCWYVDQGFSTPTCVSLLSDFAGVMLDPPRWPNHICRDVARSSVIRWRGRLVNDDGDTRLSDDAVRERRRVWPLSVGVLRFPRLPWERLIHRRSARDEYGDVRQVPLPPTPRTERAVFAARVEWEGCTLDVLGVSMGGEWNPYGPFGPLLYDLRGEDMPDDETLRVLRAARRWWTENLGMRAITSSVNAGRPRGRQLNEKNADEMFEEYLRCAVDRGHPPSQNELAPFLGVHRSTLSDWLHPGDGSAPPLPWPPVDRAEVIRYLEGGPRPKRRDTTAGAN